MSDHKISEFRERAQLAVADPDPGLLLQRGRALRRRRQLVPVVALAACAALGIGLLTSGDARTDQPPVDREKDPACASSPKEEPMTAPRSDAILAAQQEWIDQLPVGAPPLTPWWHDGVLHVNGAEIETPFQVNLEMIQVAGGTVLVGDPVWDDRSRDAEWAMVSGDRLEPLPTGEADPALSTDGRIAYWATGPNENAEVVTWDVEANRELTSRDLPGSLEGIDAAGIGYVRGTSGDAIDEGGGVTDSPVTEWDIRADTLEPSDLTWDPSRWSMRAQCSLLPDLRPWRLERGYVSPDGTREVFTGPAPGDTSTDCCTTQLRVRPVGPIESVDPSHVITLPLPEGIPHLTLWHWYSDRGTWGVWWESNETVLVDAVVDGSSYLVRCAVTGGACERVFELGPGRYPPGNQGASYYTPWASEWAFAHAPLTE